MRYLGELLLGITCLIVDNAHSSLNLIQSVNKPLEAHLRAIGQRDPFLYSLFRLYISERGESSVLLQDFLHILTDNLPIQIVLSP